MGNIQAPSLFATHFHELTDIQVGHREDRMLVPLRQTQLGDATTRNKPPSACCCCVSAPV
jgi:DNA mismatch repair ATPase MutS